MATRSRRSDLTVAEIDAWLASVLAEASRGRLDGVALVALGSYGRRDRCAGSDLDVMLLHTGRPDVAEIASACWYPIWDAGFRLDHSVRTVKECAAVAASDVRTAVGLLDARLVAGDPEPHRQLVDRVRRLWEDRASAWLRELADAVADRQRRLGEVAFLLEPDLKDGRGGLRDLQLLRAAVLARPALGPLAPELDAAGDTLHRARDALHRRAGRPLDRLLLEEQDGVASDLGYGDADALMAAVAGAGRAIAWEGDRVWHRVTRPARTKPVELAGDVELRAGAVHLTAPETTAELALRAAASSAELDVPLGWLPPLAPPEGRWPPAARDALVGVLGLGERAVVALEMLDHAGVLVALFPEWAAVRSRPQRNPYHRYTVDRHLCETAAQAAVLARRVRRPDLLLLAAWLHDIGKGSPGRDHTAAGVELAAGIVTRLGFDDADVGVVVKLVELHLVLADAATRRDIDDPATVETVATAVGSAEILDLLEALTEADGRATGPAAWTPWKAHLVAALADRVRRRLAGEVVPVEPWVPSPPLTPGVQVGPTVRVVAADRPGLFADVAGALAASGLEVRAARAATVEGLAVEEFDVEPATGVWPDAARVTARVEAGVTGSLPTEGLLADRRRHYRRRHPLPAAAPVVLLSDRATHVTIVEVRAADAPELLYRVAAELAALGLDIVQVRASTIGHEVVDVFYVRGVEQAGAEEVRRRVAGVAAVGP